MTDRVFKRWETTPAGYVIDRAVADPYRELLDRHPELEFRIHVADIRDESRIDSIFSEDVAAGATASASE